MKANPFHVLHIYQRLYSFYFNSWTQQPSINILQQPSPIYQTKLLWQKKL